MINVFTPFQLRAYRFLTSFSSFWSGSTRFYTGRSGYSLGIRQLISISKLLKMQIRKACTLLQINTKSLYCQRKFKRIQNLQCLLHLRNKGNTDFGGREGEKTAPQFSYNVNVTKLVLFCIAPQSRNKTTKWKLQ